MEYELKRRRGMRTIRAAVHAGGRLVVSAGVSRSIHEIEAFLYRQRAWIETSIEKMKDVKQSLLQKNDPKEYRERKHEAKMLIEARLEHFNKTYGLKWSRVSIKNTKRLWGSCSRKGNLNFNYKLLLIPPDLCDYVVVHELCHLIHFNHSQKFWNEVARALPDFKQRKRRLRLLSRGASLD